MKIHHGVVCGYRFLNRWAGGAVLSLVLLLLRIVWGSAFFLAGRGKLMDIQKPIGFFKDLHIPFPTANAWFVSSLECFGGLLLMVGFGSRVIALMLAVDMIVAYALADLDAVKALFKPDGADVIAFSQAAPFWFLLSSLLVLALGPGWLSIDAPLKWAFNKWMPESRPNLG